MDINEVTYGDRVKHSLFGYGKALNSFPSSNLQQVLFDNDYGEHKTLDRLVHPETLEYVPVPKYRVTVDFLNGDVKITEEMNDSATRAFTRALEPAEIISYTVRRVLSTEERRAIYTQYMDLDPQEQ